MSGKVTGTVKLLKMHNVYWLRQQVQFFWMMKLIIVIYRFQYRESALFVRGFLILSRFFVIVSCSESYKIRLKQVLVHKFSEKIFLDAPSCSQDES